jgi:uncharacterized membrane protein YdjX (TVP38/TMEM64 family)
MEAKFIALISGLLFGLIVGVFTERSSARREAIYGGNSARMLHYVTSSAVTAMPVTIIACAITGGLLFAVFVALGLAATLWGSALGFAAVEYPMRQQALKSKQDQGWTEEDARTSGL